jgi:hypothetical protein
MTEADEVAAVIAAQLVLTSDMTMDTARQIVRARMPDESMQVIDNVAESLLRNHGTQLRLIVTPRENSMGRLISIERDHLPDDAPCDCGQCEWVGPLSATADVSDAVLTPGDPSPCGRCPECEGLCYLIRAEDDMREAAPELFAAVMLTIDDADDTGCDGCFVITANTMTKLLSARDKAQQHQDPYLQPVKASATAAPTLLSALCKARDALSELNQSEEDEGALLREIDATIAAASETVT